MAPKLSKITAAVKSDIKDVTVYIGRFAPFHLGQAYILQHALKTSKLVIVLVGSSGKARTPKNPFTFEERREMIDRWDLGQTHDSVLRILPIRDFASNNMWIKSVQATVKSVMTAVCREQNLMLTDVHLTGSDRDDSTWYLNAFPQWKLDLLPPLQHKPGAADDLSATSVRKVLYETDPSRLNLQSLSTKLPTSTIRFLERFIESEEINGLRIQHSFIEGGKKKWAAAPYPVTFQTADAVIIQSGHVLVIRRGNQPGYGLWALPGGYVNQTERIKDAAVREAMEETGIELAAGKNAEEITRRMLRGSIRDYEIFDSPTRSERGRIITVAYLMRLDDTKPLPKVRGMNVPFYESNGEQIIETLDAFWLPLNQAFEQSSMWFEDHFFILEHFASQMDV